MVNAFTESTGTMAEKDRDRSTNSVDSVQPVIYQIPFPDTDFNVTGQQRTPCYKDQFPVTNLSQEIALVHACCTSDAARPKNRLAKTKIRRKDQISEQDKESNLQQKTTDVKEDNGNACSRHEVKINDALPLLDTEATNHSHCRLNGRDPRYTEVFKASLKLKGLRIDKIFAKDRSNKGKSRNMKHFEGMQDSENHNDWDKGDDWKYISLPDVKLSNEIAAGGISSRSIRSSVKDLENYVVENGATTNRSIDSWKLNTDIKHLFADSCFSRSSPRAPRGLTLDKRLPRVISRLMVQYEETPGRKIKCKNYGRKLGNIVSSERLHQLLNSNQPLKMENFYNYYPQEKS